MASTSVCCQLSLLLVLARFQENSGFSQKCADPISLGSNYQLSCLLVLAGFQENLSFSQKCADPISLGSNCQLSRLLVLARFQENLGFSQKCADPISLGSNVFVVSRYELVCTAVAHQKSYTVLKIYK